MLTRIIFVILLAFSLFIEATILPFPFFVLFSMLYFMFFEDAATFLSILVLSLIFDRLLLHPLGATAVFLFTFFIAVVLLEKLFTVKVNAWIIAITAFIGVLVYRQFVGYPIIWGIDAVVIAGLALFVMLDNKSTKKERGAI